ncbi:RNA polymerase factor sigma-54 [Ligilactobacillus aviarius]|uniref:RNA polymerase factor sigma-54 n=1 Tax=Ligilactobacillus aviarius TaxID=1606 RepID=UPI0024312999|nr:RNA polymerase factor sigma-54 [Ligilactobacillus aviarius]
MKISQNLKQKQLQKLAMTQQMQQSIKILKSTNEELTKLIKQRELENPFIEVHDSHPQNSETVDFTNLISNRQPSLDDYLLDQVHLTMRNTPIRTLVIYFIENLDDNGYLKLDVDQMIHEQKFDPTLVADALTLLHQLDPPGIGARNLQECLLLQAELDPGTPQLAVPILQNDFEQLVNKNWNQIATKYSITEDDAIAILHYVQTLSPAPGLGYQHPNTEYIYPDLKVTVNDGILAVTLTKHALPQLTFNQEYFEEMNQSADPAVQSFVNQKKREYDQLDSQINQREKTILMVGQAIIARQQKFFTDPTHPLKPLLLRDIAHQLQLHESTISRAVNGKYLKTDFGTYELKSFFTTAARYAANQELSTDSVQRMIQDLVANEDPHHPLSDQKIVDLLTAKEIKISRRTVTKYRSQLGIPSSSKRKQ